MVTPQSPKEDSKTLLEGTSPRVSLAGGHHVLQKANKH